MQILHSNNPLNPTVAPDTYSLRDGITGNEAFAEMGLSPAVPVLLVVNGEVWRRAKWDDPLPAQAVVIFVDLPQGWPLILAIVAVLISCISFWYASQIDTGGGDTGTPNSIYSFSTGSNRLRIGEPFAEFFGRRQRYPDLAQQSYIQNIDNDQYLYFLGIIGIGRYDVEEVFIENTPLTDYADSQYNVLPPGTIPTLVPNVVWTCNEVSSQELSTEWVAYIVSAVGTEAYHLEYDLTFTGGLVSYNDEGGRCSVSVTIQAEARTVDKLGAALTEWIPLDEVTCTADSKDPLRYSRKVAAPYGAGRYQVRVCRTDEASQSSRVANKVHLTGLRAYGGPHPEYEDLTLIEAKIKATDQLSGDAGSQINVVATRMLYPVTASGPGSVLTATRSIADACAYMVTADNGGRQSVATIDWPSLYELRTTWEAAGYYFDHIFTSRTSVMEACAMAATCGRAVPYMPGGLFSLVQDVAQPVPTCVFTRDNIHGLTITSKPRTEDSPTSVIMTYLDPETWEEQVVTCLDEHGSEDNPSEITLDGCASRQQAYEIGMYIYQQDRLERTSVEFGTDLIGHIPSLLSKVIVPNTMIRWGQDGLIMAVDTDKNHIWLSDPVDFDGASDGALYICLPNGSTGGPYRVYPTDYAHCVSGAIPELQPLSEHDLKATRYTFGPMEVAPMCVRVGKIAPQGRDQIRITGNLIDDAVYADPGPAPEIGSLLPIILLASINLIYSGLNEETGYRSFFISWAGSADAVLIELSEDEGSSFSTLVDNYSSYSKSFTSIARKVIVRVTPYGPDLVLDNSASQTIFHVCLPDPSGLLVSYDANGITATWDAYTDASAYDLTLSAEGLGQSMIGRTTDTTYSINMTQIEAKGGPWSEVTISLAAVTTVGVSPFISVTAPYIAPLSCVEGMVTLLAVEVSGTSIILSWSGAASQFDILVEQASQEDIIVTQMSGSQRIISGLVAGDFTATVTPYAGDGTVCTGQAEIVTGTII